MAPREVNMQHAIREFAQGVSFMAQDNSDIGVLVERLVSAMDAKAERHAAIMPQKPKMHPLLIAVASALIVMIPTALVGYGALQQRVLQLEGRTQNIDRLNSIESKLDSLGERFSNLESRYNGSLDRRK